MEVHFLSFHRMHITLSPISFTSCSASGCGIGMYIEGGDYLSACTFSNLTFTFCQASMGSNVFVSTHSLAVHDDSELWTNLFAGLIPSQTDIDKYIGRYDNRTVDIAELIMKKRRER